MLKENDNISEANQQQNTDLDNDEKYFLKIITYFHKIDCEKSSVFNGVKILQEAKTPYKPYLKEIEVYLKKNYYRKNYWTFIKDVTLALKLLIENRQSRSKLYQNAVECLNYFHDKMDFFMKVKGYCCARWYIQKSKDIPCSGKKGCKVKQNSTYFRYEDWTYCRDCFQNFIGDEVKVNNDLTVHKSFFNRHIFIEEKEEEFVTCLRCKRKFHERCVMHIKFTFIPYYCPTCSKKKAAKLEDIRFNAEDLPATDCDKYIMEFLSNNRLKMPLKLTIRLVSSLPKKFKIKEKVARYQDGEDEITYNNCTLLVFYRNAAGYDVCFFAVYFQLHGNNCPIPNRNSVYISYLDSVNLYNVKQRTKTYRLTLLGLLSYLKLKNYNKIFIWSCPPAPGLDYIFHQKPPDMKIPTKKILSNWYIELFKMAKDMNVIESFTGIDKYAKENDWMNINNIPYFEADLWPMRLEEAIQEAEMYALRAAKNNKEFDINAKIWELMQVQTAGFDNQYFVLKMDTNAFPYCDIAEPLQLINCKWINNRHNLVDLFWEFMLEFSSERLAQFSTSVMIYRIMLENSWCRKCHKTSNSLDNTATCENCLRIAKQDVNFVASESETTNAKSPSRKKICLSCDQPMSQDYIDVEQTYQNVGNDIIDLSDDINFFASESETTNAKSTVISGQTYQNVDSDIIDLTDDIIDLSDDQFYVDLTKKIKHLAFLDLTDGFVVPKSEKTLSIIDLSNDNY